MSGADHLALEPYVPVGIGNLVWVDLHAALNVADGQWQEVIMRLCEQVYLVTWRQDDLFTEHLKVKRNWASSVVAELGDADVLMSVHVQSNLF
jgi:hypothetical protein